MIKDVIITPLRTIPLNGGDVMHALKRDDVGYRGFGEAYFSIVNPDTIKGWKRHRDMTSNFIVPKGKVKVVIFDDTCDVFMDEILSPDNYRRLTIPPMVWVAFKGICSQPSLLLNVANIKHDPAETDTKDINAIPYDWRV